MTKTSKRYWHIQIHLPYGRNDIIIDPKKMLENNPSVIGINGSESDPQFYNDFIDKTKDNSGLKINDIILVRKGAMPIALCRVVSDWFSDESLKRLFGVGTYREVEILTWCKNDVRFPQTQGTLQKLINPETDSWKFIDTRYRKVMNKQKMEKSINLLKYKKQIILQGPPGTGKTREAKLIAQALIGLDSEQLQKSNQFKLVQFHPSYTYEDFVRGIVAKPNPDGGILYQAENKILAEFAQKALENYLDSKKDSKTISKEKRIRELFQQFIDDINENIENNGGFLALTENVGLVLSNNEKAFQYKSKDGSWLNNMYHKDILQAYFDGITERQHMKNNENVSGLARHHASYFVRVLQLFREFLNGKELDSSTEKLEEKPFVLIIDEINRANLSSVLGELIYALEYRGEAMDSMYAVDESKELILPPNLYIIGTMNTADRSVGHIDYAIRRRFAFVDMLPKDLKEELGDKFDSDLFNKVKEFFTKDDDYQQRSEYLSHEFEPKDVTLGHSYFIDKSDMGADMKMRLEYEIKPILFEYVRDGILIGDDIKQKIKQLTPSV